MARVISGTMASILSPKKRDIDYTLDLVFSDEDFHFATSPLTAVNGHNYTNELERKVGEIRQTLEAPTDQVSVSIQNKDRVLGQHVATYWQKWRKAEAVLGRYYYQVGDDGERTGTNEWIEMFRGAVQQPNADDEFVTFGIVPDTTSPGQIVCSRTLNPTCGFVFKDPATCAYSGGETACNHHLRSKLGCYGRTNTQHFGGMEHNYNPDAGIPGSGGNPVGGGFDCPRIDQYVLVRADLDRVIAKMAGFVTEDDWLWHPVLRCFYKVKYAQLLKRLKIWELVTAFGAVGYSSGRHPIIRTYRDSIGTPIERLKARGSVLAVGGEELIDTRAVIVRDTGETGDVMWFEMDAPTVGEKIYCYGDNPEKLIACHNNKQLPI